MSNEQNPKELTAKPRKSDQEIFDIAAPGLLRQGRRSQAPDGVCSYRGQNGLKCAIGFLIPDDLYQPNFEGTAPYALPPDAMAAFGLRRDSDFLLALQRLHDQVHPDAWANSLRTLAANHNLSTDCIKEWSK